MKLPAADEFLKPAKYTVNDKNSYSHWIATIVDNGKDHTDIVLEVAMVNPASLKKDENEFDPANILANKIYATHLPHVKYQPKLPVFIHPTDQNKYIPLTAGNVQKWATALLIQLSQLLGPSSSQLRSAQVQLSDPAQSALPTQLRDGLLTSGYQRISGCEETISNPAQSALQPSSVSSGTQLIQLMRST
ncbi:uncharacterized protein PGTG_06159 [Puccinia graminis f. sp. tritici CRL 75-36-700-3]|uniref:Uncharacterized protein n=1 Tax=Puccinia graminis f. sp. tritici (strain CRL 75-36-700-3 / race SCCL) TaxID=418459 RepID=E3K7X6_PUCGT|nr:uncharacterized protein PGTG_06159 [Puccinia graminis f. sp. tritici CRL 75-36-700-3]EFP80203.1 hypothetical protein PGTG_06159 [Puccinia graminis f. sp. tritici CRL 75-36-700-3]